MNPGVHHDYIVVLLNAFMHYINVMCLKLTAQHLAVYNILATAQCDNVDFVLLYVLTS